MTKYKVTMIHNDEYCMLRPSDLDCQHSVVVEAASKGEAVLRIKDAREMKFDHKKNSACPIVWEINAV